MLKPALQLKLGQQLTMTPQLQQAIKLLQMPVLELQAQVQEALETNVMLEAEDEDEPIDLASLDQQAPPSSDSHSDGDSSGELEGEPVPAEARAGGRGHRRDGGPVGRVVDAVGRRPA